MTTSLQAKHESLPAGQSVQPAQQKPSVPFHFQVNLRAIIELLSNHLYTGPQVFIRELLQNCVDAVRARHQTEATLKPEITIEVVSGREGRPSTLIFEDNGIGLTMQEIHEFLATIGSSSKREDLQERRVDYIGQFGIGLLSCFIVTEEIVVITRSAKPNQQTLEWKGKADGSYEIRVLEQEMAPGTKVFLRARPEREEYFESSRVRDLARHYGALLTFPISVVEGSRKVRINDQLPPWKQSHTSEAARQSANLDYGRDVFKTDFFDCIPLKAPEYGLEGAAFVLPFAPNLASKRGHRVYLKGMLLTEQADSLLPDWAFFVRCVIDSNLLRPTASREAVYEDETLAATRKVLGEALRGYLIRLSTHDPEKLRKLIDIHHVSLKSLSAQDEEFCKLFIGFLPFETSLGEMTLNEYKHRYAEIQFVTKLDEFRQISQVAAAQSLCIINAGYAFDTQLLEKHARLFPDCPTRKMALEDFVAGLKEMTLEERTHASRMISLAEATLHPLKCRVGIKKFLPRDLPVLYAASDEALVMRAADQAKQVSGPLWSAIVENALQMGPSNGYAELCLNYANPVVQQLLVLSSTKVMRLIIETLYVQALLLGHHTVTPREMRLLNHGLTELVELIVRSKQD